MIVHLLWLLAHHPDMPPLPEASDSGADVQAFEEAFVPFQVGPPGGRAACLTRNDAMLTSERVQAVIALPDSFVMTLR